MFRSGRSSNVGLTDPPEWPGDEAGHPSRDVAVPESQLQAAPSHHGEARPEEHREHCHGAGKHPPGGQAEQSYGEPEPEPALAHVVRVSGLLW